MKGFLKSFGLVMYFFLVQLAASVGVFIYKIVTDTYWVDEVYFTVRDYGLMSSQYMSIIFEILYPALIIGDILLIFPFVIKDKCSFLKEVSKQEAFEWFCLGAVLNFIVSYVVTVLPTSDYDSLMSVVLNGNPLLIMLTSGILAPIVEELIFRFGMFKVLRGTDKTKIIISSLLFGLAHMNLVQSTYAFILGLILGKAYAKDKNLVPALILHLTINSTSVLYEYAGQFGQKALLVGVAFCLFYLLLRGVKYERA